MNLASKVTAHIGYVSDQPLPNILPVLQPLLRPEKVYLLCSKQQAQKGHGKAQAEVLRRLKIGVELIEIDDAFDIASLQTEVQKVIDRYRDHPGTLLFNATGGTKPMSIAAYELCYSDNVPVFYLQTPDILWLNRPTDIELLASPLKIEASLGLADFLAAHGVMLQSAEQRKVADKQYATTTRWARLAKDNSRWFRELNGYAANAKDSLRTEFKPGKNRLPDDLEKLDMLSFDKNTALGNISIVFKDEAARFFANGGWLEDYVFMELKALQENYPAITEVARSVKVEFRPGTTRQEVKNELDVVALVNNQLWVFECKTKRMTGTDDADGKSEEMVYKLATLKNDLGGLRTQGCVVSFNQVRDVEKSRAEQLQIAVIDGANLPNLRSKLAAELGLSSR